MAQENDRECLIRVGETVLALCCPSADYAASVREYFNAPGSGGDPHVRLTIRIMPHEGEVEIPNSLFTTKTVSSDEFTIADGLVRGRFLPEERTGELWVNYVLTKGPVTRVFEQLLYQAFYSARKVSNYDAFLIHSSGVIRDGNGFLFVGASESGKSTVAQLSQKDTVLNDEIDLVSFTPDGVELHGTPFNGDFRDKSEGSAPLKGVFLLAHGPSHRLRTLSKAEAVTAIAGQIVPPIGLEEELTQKERISMLELADRLSRLVPVQQLEFRPDSGFWEVIDREFVTA